MRLVKILLISHSEILKIGVKCLIAKVKGINCNVMAAPHSVTTEFIVQESPEIIIIDPMTMGNIDVEKIKEETPAKIIALYHSALPKELLSHFDSSISIYDDMSTINKVLDEALQAETEEESKVLSQREKDVVVGIVKGMTNKEIAAEINVSVNTVMTHRRNIASKLQIHSPAGLTIYAIVSKLVRLDEIQAQLPR